MDNQGQFSRISVDLNFHRRCFLHSVPPVSVSILRAVICVNSILANGACSVPEKKNHHDHVFNLGSVRPEAGALTVTTALDSLLPHLYLLFY